ncbi:MAG TPA: CoA transferase [Candidatus Binataceae bacterium]|nr:CoA transferase [Candidatus Binataceae bacterium]
MAQPTFGDATEGSPSSSNLPLAGVCVVECGQGVSAAFGAKLMALLGARVIKVEPPQGDLTRRRGPFVDDVPDPERSGLFLYLNADKRGMTLDLANPRERQTFDELLTGADILIHNIAASERAASAIEGAQLSARHPHLIIAAISRYGDSGPRSHYKAYELNTIHASGTAILNPLLCESPDLPPLKYFGAQAEYQAGIHAAMTALAAFTFRTKSDEGQAIEISEQECMASMLDLSMVWFTYQKLRTSRLGFSVIGPGGAHRCSDGLMQIVCAEEAQWHRLVELMGNPEWAREEIFKDRTVRGKNIDALKVLIEQWSQSRRLKEVVAQMQARRIPAAPVSQPSDIYADEHLKAREFLVPLPAREPAGKPILAPGVPFKSTTMGWVMRRPAPRRNEHAEEILRELSARPAEQISPAPQVSRPQTRGPLQGVRVLDFSWVWAGPFCTAQMARLGAEVIRIETARHPCISRLFVVAEGKPGLNRAGCYNEKNHNKLSVQLDLEKPEAVEIVRQLARHCDIAAENFAPGVVDRLGIGYQSLRAARPDLIMLSMAGYGQTGPFRNYVSYGPIVAAHCGMHTLTTYPGDRPRNLGIGYGDPVVGIFGAWLLNAALIHRERTGQGQYIDLSNLEAMEMMMPEALLEYAMNGRDIGAAGNHDPLMSPYNCYKALGDAEAWVTIAVGTEDEWRALCDAMGKPSMASDPRFGSAAARKRNEEELDRIINAWTSERDRWAITELLQRAGVAAMPTFTNQDVAEDRHLRERGFLVDLDHPEVGVRTYTGVPWTMSRTPCKLNRVSPCLGQDSAEVLCRLLNYTPEQIEELRRTEVIA